MPNWINENIKANFIDNNSNKISKLVNPENHNFSISELSITDSHWKILINRRY